MQSINYSEALAGALTRAGMDGQTVQLLLVKFALAAAKSNELETFLSFMDSYANESEHVLLASLIDDAIKRASEKTIDGNPITRTKSYIERQNRWLENADKLGIEGGTPLDAEKLKMKMPSYIKPDTESNASYKSLQGLELEVR